MKKGKREGWELRKGRTENVPGKGREQVDEVVMVWTVVMRNKKQKRWTVQIFVKVNVSAKFITGWQNQWRDKTDWERQGRVRMFRWVLKRNPKRSFGVIDGHTEHDARRRKDTRTKGARWERSGTGSDKSEKDGVIQFFDLMGSF